MNTKNTELYHHGILGQKWGIRRYQNDDGSYKNGATGRYNNEESGPSGKFKKAAKTGAIVVGSALAVYGAYKLSKHLRDRGGTEKEQNVTKKAVNVIKSLPVRPIPNQTSNADNNHPKFTKEKMDDLLKSAEQLKKAASDSSKNSKTFKPNLKFDDGHPEFTKEDMNKLLKNAEKLRKATSDNGKQFTNIGEDLVNDLLKKNGKSLGL